MGISKDTLITPRCCKEVQETNTAYLSYAPEDAYRGENGFKDIHFNEKNYNVINIPYGLKVVHFGTDKEAAEHQRVLYARGAFAEKYMKEKGWGENFTDLSIKQIMEIREQKEWKRP